MADVHLRPEGDERFIYIAARHPIALVLRAALPVAVAAIAVLLFGLRVLQPVDPLFGTPPPLLDPLNALLLLLIGVSVVITIYIYYDWRNDHLIISNKRIVLEDRTLWLSYQYETIPIEQVQNVNIQIGNIFQYVLKYGRVEVQAAGPTSPIVFDRARNPTEIQRQVLGEVQREKRSQEQRRLNATVERRFNPHAPPVPPLHIEAADQIQPLSGPLQALLPLSPQLQSGTIIWHRHWIVLLQHLIGPLVALLVWLLLLVLLPRTAILSSLQTTLVLFGLLLVVALYFVWQYENWRNDIYILEPSRIIDIQRLPFGLYEDRREALLGVIQNISATSPNLVARLLGYGNVLIETAGTGGNFTFSGVPDPDQVQRIVFEYRERFRWQQRERDWLNAMEIADKVYQARSNRPPQP